jgi:hypothetical protein
LYTILVMPRKSVRLGGVSGSVVLYVMSCIRQSTSRLPFVSSDSDGNELTGVKVGEFFEIVINFDMQVNHNVG